jgi:hypothetical protein
LTPSPKHSRARQPLTLPSSHDLSVPITALLACRCPESGLSADGRRQVAPIWPAQSWPASSRTLWRRVALCSGPFTMPVTWQNSCRGSGVSGVRRSKLRPPNETTRPATPAC